MELTKCDKCQQTGGRMRLVGEKWIHVTCIEGAAENRDTAKSTFPFETTHLNGEKVTVQSLHHLRKLEAQHGVHSGAYN